MELVDKIRLFFDKGSDSGSIHGAPNSGEDILQIEEALSIRVNQLYKDIISHFGSCYLGIEIHSLHPEKLLGNTNVVELTKWFREKISSYCELPEYKDFLAISIDGSGNYILIKDDSNQLFMYNHESNEIEHFHDYGQDLNELDRLILDYISEAGD